ncbi:hypothetical protein [Synergistes jonesii]|uniref:hypothetical protein n=1 Tax=Synergistes jonesii TaxID=2754 RepID=UPI00248D6581|nr:hypothetical protein [Synergistes jonesii]
MKAFKFFASAVCALILAATCCAALNVGTAEDGAASAIGRLLINELAPEKIEVAVSEGVEKAWVRCRGSKLSGLRVELMELSASLAANPAVKESAASLAEVISESKGRMILKEEDVNEYFANGRNAGVFSDMRFRFLHKGFTASGKFESDLLFTKIELELEAKGKLALRSDGVYLEETDISLEGVRQPRRVTEFIIGRINPLLSFSKISFPVSFTSVDIAKGTIALNGKVEKIAAAGAYKWSGAD